MTHYSFILVCYDNWKFTKQTLASLLESFDLKHRTLGVELIIINNGSKDETFESLKNIKANYKGDLEIVLVDIEENLGYTLALNIGLSKANGNIITVLNNDLIFPKGWFNGLAEALDNDSSLGVAVPYLSYASGLQDVGVRFGSKEEIQDFANKFTNENKGSISYSSRVISACLSMKREVFNLIGGYDFWFGLGMYDDDDWCLRIRLSGYKIGVIGDSFVYHLGNATFSKDNTNWNFTSAAFLSNGKKFMKKWNLKGVEYEEGLYLDREECIENTPYKREKHYFPVKAEDYLLVSKDEGIESKINKCLLIADWTNFKSEWAIKLEDFLLNYKDTELHLLIPKEYFEEKEVLDKVMEVVEKFEDKDKLLSSTLKIIYENINPIELITFISGFDNVLVVKNDYVNKLIINLANEANIEII